MDRGAAAQSSTGETRSMTVDGQVDATSTYRARSVELLEEVVFLDALGALEEAGEVPQQAAAAPALFQVGQPGQVDGQRGRQQAVASLPGELEGHLGSQEPLEVDVVPGGLPVAHVGEVLDRDERRGLVAEDLGHDPVLGLDLRRLVGGIVEDQAVAIAEDVVADPAHDLEVADGEHRGEDRFHQGLAGLAVLAGMKRAAWIRPARRARAARHPGWG